MSERHEIRLSLRLHHIEIKKIRRLAHADTAPHLTCAGLKQVEEGTAPPVFRRFADIGWAVFDDGLLLDAIVPPAKGASLVNRVERIHEDNCAREFDPRPAAALAEAI